MKKFLIKFAILAAVILISSCQKELPDVVKNIDVSQGGQTPTPTPGSELNVSEPGQFGAKGGEQTITVTAPAAWTIRKSSGNDWLTIKPESGNAGTTQVTLTAAENTTTGSRTATLTIKSGELTKSINVSQSAATPEILLDINNMEFTSGSASKTFKISSNTSWTVSSDQTWCNISPTYGNGDGSVTVNVEENSSTSERSATITVKSDAGNKTVSVKQSGGEVTPVPTPSTSQYRTFTVGGVQFKMVFVEGGTFTMGATGYTLSSYSIGETEVTQALWQAVMGSNPSYFKGNNRPVEQVTLTDCQTFVKKLNSITGENFRLPTEAEWEYAARGGNKSLGYRYAGSNTIGNVAWYSGNSNSQTHDVATKQANELGIFDMSGNVREWCSDPYLYGHEEYVIRGGAWYSDDCPISKSEATDYYNVAYFNGFRLVL